MEDAEDKKKYIIMSSLILISASSTKTHANLCLLKRLPEKRIEKLISAGIFHKNTCKCISVRQALTISVAVDLMQSGSFHKVFESNDAHT